MSDNLSRKSLKHCKLKTLLLKCSSYLELSDEENGPYMAFRAFVQSFVSIIVYRVNIQNVTCVNKTYSELIQY